MNEPEFNVALRGGLYMDSNGNVHRGIFPAAPTYPLPGGGLLPITQESFEKAISGTTKAFEGIVKILPDQDDPDSIQRFMDLGVPDSLINVLSTLGGVAAQFAKVIPIVGAVVVVAEQLIKIFSPGGPSPLELMMKAQFAAVHVHLDAIAMQAKLDFINTQRTTISTAMRQLNEYLETTTDYQPSLSELQRELSEIRDAHKDVAKALEILLTLDTWLLSYNPDTFKYVWEWVGDLLFLMPAGSPPPAPVKAPSLPPYQNRFEHGMMVPIVLHVVQSYLTLIKALVPEYRSTGDFNEELEQFGDLLENLTVTMRRETLARTIYPGRYVARDVLVHDFLDLYDSDLVLVPAFGIVEIAENCHYFPVGALDLCNHTDAYFRQKTDEAYQQGGANAWLGPEIVGNMHPRWIPPARLEPIEPQPPARVRSSYPTYHFTNREECIAAANAQSEIDYANLLLASGYLNLVQATVLLRHLATEPNRSETVKGDVNLLRYPFPATDTTVKSRDIVFTGVIKSRARREPAACRAILPVRTQPLREDRMLPYRIVLRTFQSIRSPYQWEDADYGDYYSAYYEPVPGNPKQQRLVTKIIDWRIGVLDERVLISGTSPQALTTSAGDIALKAATFDWYVPADLAFSDDGLVSDHVAALGSAGWTGARRELSVSAAQRVGGAFRDRPIVDLHPWYDGAQNWAGFRRELEEATVKLRYSLTWKADRLEIILDNHPGDRNYVVFLVVEETLPPSGQILHTAFPVPMNGQLTYVPRKFFDDEKAAIDRANKILHEVERRFSESAPPGPEDPFVARMARGDIYTAEGLQDLASLAQQQHPALLQQVVQNYKDR